MTNKYIISAKNLLTTIETNIGVVGDLGITKWDLLAIVVEYIEFSSSNWTENTIQKYLTSCWLLEDSAVPKIEAIVKIVLRDLYLICPEITTVIKSNKALKIMFYNKHFFILESF